MIVTIVTPTLNAVDYLKECIESARENEAPGIEIEHVIVDVRAGSATFGRWFGVRGWFCWTNRFPRSTPTCAAKCR